MSLYPVIEASFLKCPLMSALVNVSTNLTKHRIRQAYNELTFFADPVILNTMMKQISRIVSGGQSGADRAALDWALS
jgi:hypothetical protein